MLYCNTWYLCSSFWRTWIRYDISRRAVVWWRINAWCIFHGNRLRYIPYYTKGTAYIWYLTWYSDRNLRLFGGSAEGVSYAIIFCNLLVPLIEKVTTPTAFGKGGKK